MLPSLTYSQYPKQTIINGDSVVIMTTKQAVKMNQVFISKNNTIEIKSDSIKLLSNSVDSLTHLPKQIQFVKVERTISASDLVGVIVFLIYGSFAFFMIK